MCEHRTLEIEYQKTEDSGSVTLWYACKDCSLGFHAYRVANVVDIATGRTHPVEDWAPTLGEHFPSLSL
jgi:hypothetical protein